MQQPQMAPQGTAATSGASGITGSALDTIYDMGLAAYKRGNWAQASQLLREVAKRQPGYERDGQLATGLLMEVERQMEAEAKGKQAKGKKKAAAMPAGTATSTASAAVRRAKASGQQGLASRGLLVPLIIAGVVVLLLLVIAAFLLLRPHEPAQGGSQAPNTVEQVAGETGVGIQGTATAQTAQMMAAAQAVEGTATAQVTALFDVYTHWDLVHEIAGHTDEVRSVAFSSDGKTLASGSYDQSVRLWNTADWSAAGVLTGPARPVLSVAFSPDGGTVAAGSDEGKVWLWKLSDPSHPSQLDHGGRVFSVAYSPDGKFLASGSGDTGDTNVKIWDLQGDPKPAVRTLPFTRTDEMKTAPAGGQVPSNNYIRALAFSPDGKLLATGSADKLIRLWQVQGTSSSPDLTLAGHTGIVYTVAFSPDGKLLASGSNDMTVRLWSLPDGKPFGKPLSDQTASITGVAFSPDGRVLASGSSDGTVNVWRLDDGSKLADLKEPSDKTTSVAFAPDGSVLVSGSGAANDGKIRVWGLPAK